MGGGATDELRKFEKKKNKIMNENYSENITYL